MGLVQRLGRIITANLHGLLDRVENPLRMLALIMRDMENALSGARQYAVSLVADENRLLRERDQCAQAAEAWKERARLALDHGRDDLARLALARHLENVDLGQTLTQQHRAAQERSAQARETLRTLQHRLEEARRHQRLLEARQAAGQLQVTAGNGEASPFTRFTQLEHRLIELEDDLLVQQEIDVIAPLETQLAHLEADQRMTRALDRLKEERLGEC